MGAAASLAVVRARQEASWPLVARDGLQRDKGRVHRGVGREDIVAVHDLRRAAAPRDDGSALPEDGARSPSPSASISASISPSASISASISTSASISASISTSASISASISTSAARVAVELPECSSQLARKHLPYRPLHHGRPW